LRLGCGEGGGARPVSLVHLGRLRPFPPPSRSTFPLLPTLDLAGTATLRRSSSSCTLVPRPSLELPRRERSALGPLLCDSSCCKLRAGRNSLHERASTLSSENVPARQPTAREATVAAPHLAAMLRSLLRSSLSHTSSHVSVPPDRLWRQQQVRPHPPHLPPIPQPHSPRCRALADPALAARRLKQEGDEVRPCQNCHNQSCVRVKRSKRFELFWVPL